MKESSHKVAKWLLDIGAVKVRPEKPFTWASGWLSPFYCDNRMALSYPGLRTLVRDSLCDLIEKNFSQFDVIAGVATGAIAQGALVADKLGKPFVYVRSKPKDHGMANLIEGFLPSDSRVVVVEDLVSTGGSSLKAVQALREAGASVQGMVASFTYGFKTASDAFLRDNVKLETILDYDDMLSAAIETGQITDTDLETLKEWRANPSEWRR